MSHAKSSNQYIDVDEQEDLWHRIHKSHIKIENGIVRPSSAAFKGNDVSVDIGRKTTPQKSIGDSAALAGFKASVPIQLGHRVVEDPIIPENPAHALILGKINKRKARLIRDNSEWVIKPTIL